MIGYIWLGSTIILLGLLGLVLWDFVRKKEAKLSPELEILLKSNRELNENIKQLLEELKLRNERNNRNKREIPNPSKGAIEG